mgnify:CR=1 FL=1
MKAVGLGKALLLVCLLITNMAIAREEARVAFIISQEPSDVSITYQDEIDLLEKTLQDRQVTVDRLDWQSPNIDWQRYRLVLIGNIGTLKGYRGFGKWCRMLEQLGVPLQNSSRALNFYLNKSHYIERLASHREFAIPTQVIPQGNTKALLKEIQSKSLTKYKGKRWLAANP